MITCCLLGGNDETPEKYPLPNWNSDYILPEIEQVLCRNDPIGYSSGIHNATQVFNVLSLGCRAVLSNSDNTTK
jgi:hypothetical protein